MTEINKNTKYSQEFRNRKTAQELFEVRGIYAPKSSHAQIKKYAAKVAKKRDAGAKENYEERK